MTGRKLLVGFLFLLQSWQVSVAQTPNITYSLPHAVRPGRANDVTFLGENLGSATELWLSFPGKAVVKTSETAKAVFQLTLPQNTPPGIGAVRLGASNGVSSFSLLLIDDLPDTLKNGSNKTVSTAQVLKLPVAVDGACDELSFDYYRFSARKGQLISVEVVSQRLGSLADPVIRLLDARGRELAYCDDDPSVGRDARFEFKAPAAGEYTIELRDINYQGGPRHRYRLRLGDFPLASSTFPLAAVAGPKRKFQILGSNVAGLKPVTLDLPDTTTRVSIAVKSSRHLSSGFLSAFCRNLPAMTETEPNDTTNAANQVTLPVAIDGRFEKNKDRDRFRFEVKKDQRLVFRAKTRSLGSPCDVFMELQKEDGSKVTQANVTGADEGTITNTFKEAGSYQLVIEELNRRGAPDLAYRVEIEPAQPGFALSVEEEKVHGTNGASVEIKVTATRYDYSGPIKLSVEGLDEEFALENALIEEKKTNAAPKLKIPADFEGGRVIHFRLAGEASIAGCDVKVIASTLPALRALFPNMTYPPPELDGSIAFGLLPPGVKPPAERPRRRRN